MTELPEPFHLTLDAFLKGPGNEDAKIVVDRIFAKRLPAVLSDLAEDDLDSIAVSDWQFERASPSDVRPAFRFMGVSAGVLLVDDRRRIVGAYAGSDLVLKPALHGFGLGRELVLERALRDGSLPVWSHDRPGYSPAGLAAHQSAWNRAQDDPSALLERMGRIS